MEVDFEFLQNSFGLQGTTGGGKANKLTFSRGVLFSHQQGISSIDLLASQPPDAARNPKEFYFKYQVYSENNTGGGGYINSADKIQVILMFNPLKTKRNCFI
jgi:hypothetical protein